MKRGFGYTLGTGGRGFAYGEADHLVERAVDFLVREGSMEFGESPWPTYGEDQDVFTVDWKTLFPEKTRPQQAVEEHGYGLEPENDPWPFDATRASDLIPLIQEASKRGEGQDFFGEEQHHAGWDVCAWYQPIHFFGYDWGIFIREEFLYDHAKEILRFVRFPSPVPRAACPHIYKSLIRASFLSLFLHEHFHHKIECLGFRLHVAQLASAYIPYHKTIYRPNMGKDTLIEEALANADAYRRLNTAPYKNWIWKPILDATRRWMEFTFNTDPPGYRIAVSYLSKKAFDEGENILQGQMRDTSLTPQKTADDWDLAPRMTQSMFTICGNIWTVVPTGNRTFVPVLAPPRTCSTDAVLKLLAKFGYRVVPGGKGSHIKLKKDNSPTMIVPGNRKDLSPGVIRNVLRGLGDYALKDLTDLLFLHT